MVEIRQLLKRLLGRAALLLLVMLSLGLAVLALDDILWPLTVEEGLVRSWAASRNPTWNEVTKWMSLIGATGTVEITLAIVVVTFRLAFRRWREAAFVVAAVLVQALVFLLTTQLISRPRPADGLGFFPGTASFPSGHAGAALALYGSIAVVLGWRFRRHWIRILLAVVLLVPPVGVAYARIYRGMHFPSDIAGALINAGLSIAIAAKAVLWADLSPQLREILDLRPPAPPRPRVTVIVHPLTVPDRERLRGLLEQRCRAHGYQPPEWLETTVNDAGTGLASAALDRGTGLVLCCGGDGTVMAVVTALAGTGVPMGLLPSGTGNLLARNLGIPLDLGAAVDVALGKEELVVDVGKANGHHFAVMAGIGFDAAMVGDAGPVLKKRLGWPAYVVSGVRHLLDPPMVARMDVDGTRRVTRGIRAVVVGNVGRLQGGVELLPDADPTDGLLDVAIIAPRRLWGWLRMGVRVLRGRDDRALERFRIRRLHVTTNRPQPHELDGEAGAPVTSMTFEVEPAALIVRVPT